MSSDQVLGVVLLIRHGDRQGFYQDPDTYTASSTAITPLGNQQEYQLGQLLRSIYLNDSSPSYIHGISTGLFDQNQVAVSADAGGEGGVIVDSANSLVQGLFPATTSYNTTLANGSTIVGPLNGYQYVPIQTVEPDKDVSLEGWTDCNTFNDATLAFYNSSLFQAVQKSASPFLSQLPPYLDGRSVSLTNMWNIFDFMNVNYIHNATFAANLPPTFLAQARALANFHEYGVFSSPQLDGIGNVAIQTMLPGILAGVQNIANASDPTKLVYTAIAYKPFLSLFNVTGVARTYPELAGIVDYASAVALEIRQPSGGGAPAVRMNFRNGTEEFVTYNMFGADGDVAVQTFVDALAPAAINTTAQWCTACANTVDRGCSAYFSSPSSHQNITPVGAGFLGAGLTGAVTLIMFGVLMWAGVLAFGGRVRVRRRGGERRLGSGGGGWGAWRSRRMY
ncbi:phosphoglycerate mutase-like protein [Neolentinus lepideus HHB14362 ss-1]|uniref:Phosphoglycerate mutase-like protein n=1 Tax=Neolentinus lepideus HHB14362 ss-1 TaxID=1314782 RepID=A0A165UXC5_9AGAM|nr:phosphoglycerate mutase-like protein [Neolentinus lepideus HHB14362 ss-1]